jgi:hypothetical protein
MSFVSKRSSVVAQPVIAVQNVRASSRWYATLLDADALPEHRHRDVYDRISHSGRLLLRLYAWDEEEHPNLVHPDVAPPGHGVVLGFQVDEFDETVSRAIGLKADIIKDTHFNPHPRHRELCLRDPDGYVVLISSPDGEFDI